MSESEDESPMRRPPTLLELTIGSAVRHVHLLPSLASIPDSIVLQLFHRTLAHGKLTEPVLRVFLATGNEQIRSFVARHVQPIIKPVLPTRCSDR